MLVFEVNRPPDNTGLGIKFKIEGESFSEIDKVTEILNSLTNRGNKDSVFFLLPVIEEEIEKYNLKTTIKIYGGIMGWLTNKFLWAIRKFYKRIGREKWVKIYNLEVPNE